MKLNTEYKPEYCADLSDIKAGLNRLHLVCSDTTKKPVMRRILKYGEIAKQFDADFSALVYFKNL